MSIPPKILIIDDDAESLKHLAHLFKKCGADVITALSGEQGVSIASSNQFDLVVLDMRMPQMSGLATADALRAGGYTGPIIAATFTPSGAGRANSKEHGFNGYFDKATLTSKLVEALLEQHCPR